MKSSLNRRQFIQKTSLTAAAFYIGRSISFGKNAVSPNEKLNIGVIGTANRAAQNIEGIKHQNIVALCDVDDILLANQKANFPGAKTYNDFRKMMDQKDIDAVLVSTADHTHAVATMAALKSGRHVYCEKPLAHTVSEARLVAEAARKYNRVTQMGTQIHAEDNYRRVVEAIRSGAIGKVREVHVWVSKVYTAPGRPTETPPVPPNLNWDLWLGPAPERPYNPAYVPFNWRNWWDFGGGTLSDMGCHFIDLPFWALGLTHPLSVESEGPAVHPECTPSWLISRYDFLHHRNQLPVKLIWYHGERDGKQVVPPLIAEHKLPAWSNGVLFVGEKGMMMADYSKYVLLPENKFAGFVPPPQTIAKSIGHHEEWIHACKFGGPTTCNFAYSGALTETVLLGNVAYRTGRKIYWDPKTLKAINAPNADQFIQHHYRAGWKI